MNMKYEWPALVLKLDHTLFVVFRRWSIQIWSVAPALCRVQCLVLVRDQCHLGLRRPKGGACITGGVSVQGSPHLCVILLTGLNRVVEGSIALLCPERVMGGQDKILRGGQPVHLVVLHFRQLHRHLLVVAGGRGGHWMREHMLTHSLT